jgi:rubredoxin
MPIEVDYDLNASQEPTCRIRVGNLIIVVTNDVGTANIHVWQEAHFEDDAVAVFYVDADVGNALAEPYDCERCGNVYDEASGDGFCGLCPTCADETEEPDTTNYQETAFREA